MRFYLPFVIVTALVGLALANPIPSLETRQQPPEAVRFGVVNVEPTTFKVNEPFTVIYNSTFARWQPLTLDIYMHGVYPNGFVTPDFQLLRTDYPSDAHVYYLNTTLPVLADVENNGYLTDGAYGITAWITFATSTGAISRGGISSGFTIDFS